MEVCLLKPAPLMFAAIVIVIFLFLLVWVLIWGGTMPGPYFTANPASP